jgi:hypothetical protein
MHSNSIDVIGAYESRGAHSHKRPYERSPVDFSLLRCFLLWGFNGTGFFQGEVFRLLFGVDQGGEGGVIKDQVYRIDSFELSGGGTVSDP